MTAAPSPLAAPSVPDPAYNAWAGHPMASRYARPRQTWEDLLPDCNGEPDNRSVAIQVVRFCASGLYHELRAFPQEKRSPGDLFELATIPQNIMAVINQDPVRAVRIARETLAEYEARRFNLVRHWPRRKAREVLFARLDGYGSSDEGSAP